MAEHEQITEELGIKVYFAHPYSSWERGVNENTNELIRQYFPKDRELTGITREDVEQPMKRLNHRPRKTLGFRTPYEVFFSTPPPLTVASKYLDTRLILVDSLKGKLQLRLDRKKLLC